MISAIEAFQQVRGLPYATDGAHSGAELRRQGRGDCVAKAEVLAARLSSLGVATRLVRWRYRLPLLVPEQRALRFTDDIHTAVQARVGTDWILVDATHDPALDALGLTVATWDGIQSTPPAYEPVGPIWVVGHAPDDAAYARALADVLATIRTTPEPAIRAYRVALNRAFDDARAAYAAPPA